MRGGGTARAVWGGFRAALTPALPRARFADYALARSVSWGRPLRAAGEEGAGGEPAAAPPPDASAGAAAAAEGGVVAGAEKKQRPARVSRPPKYKAPVPPPCPDRIVAAHVVERLPVITPELEPWEVAYYELKERKDLQVRKKMPDEWFKKPGQEDIGDVDDKDKEQMQIAPRTSEADEKNDIRSLDRGLARRLYLVVKGKDGKWGFPQAERQEGEGMRAAALRGLVEHCGEDFKIIPVGNCPMAYWDGAEGGGTASRTFYYYSQYYQGDLELKAPLAVDHTWAKREELEGLFDDKELVQQVLADICDP